MLPSLRIIRNTKSVLVACAFLPYLLQATDAFVVHKPLASFSTVGTKNKLFQPKSSFTLHVGATTDTGEEKASFPTVNLFNSLSRKKEPLIPLDPEKKKISMYTCGPTVYDFAHIGNFRAFLTYDIIKRVFQYFGYKVDHICNLTDIDDKIINKCNKENISVEELTNKYADLFMEDLSLLNIIPAREYPRATKHIEEMVQMIQDLESNGYAYQSDEGSWYYNVQAKEGYGQQLVNLDVGNMKKGAGCSGPSATDADEYDADKVGVQDFALWKAYKPGKDRDDATWDTRIGKGRPGWHLECSAMSKKYLGNTIDIHAGGIDLKFPHHENEIAQSEGANGEKFCNCWMHNGFVNIGDEKMSKSKGNFLTLRNACDNGKPETIRAYRYLVVSSQYRNPLSFTNQAMGAAKGALKRMDKLQQDMREALENYTNEDDYSDSDMSIQTVVDKEMENFESALMDDLSMPRAAASLFSIIKVAEVEFKRFRKEKKAAEEDDSIQVTPLNLQGIQYVKTAIEKMDEVFGIFYTVPIVSSSSDHGEESSTNAVANSETTIPEEVMQLVEERTMAKDSKDWDLADSLRTRITELGYTVKDIKGGPPEVMLISD